MTRRLITILVILLAGAATNVAVTCWFAMSGVAIRVRQLDRLGPEDAGATWAMLAPPEWPPPIRPNGIRERARGREVTLLMADREEAADAQGAETPGGAALGLSEFRFGWPMLALRLTHVVDAGQPVGQRGSIVGGWQLVDEEPSLGATVGGTIPYRPIMPGFLINTLGYSLVVWLAVGLPLVAWRWSRLRRGLCPSCGYPAGASGVCTECGKPL